VKEKALWTRLSTCMPFFSSAQASDQMSAQPVIEFAFRPRATAQAAAWLLNKDASRPVTVLELLKWLYLTDRRLLTDIGVPLTGDHLVSFDNGPSLSTTYDLVRGKEEDERVQQIWDQYVGPPDPSHVLIAKVPGPKDAPEETYDSLTPRQLAALTALRVTPTPLKEWEYPYGSSRPINPAAILVAEHWKQADIDAVAKEAAANLAIDKLIGYC
jgi:Protein of unknown function (DUF4065)